MYIGVDGGGTKTTVALADEKGNIVARVTGGPSSPRNMGIDATVENIDKLIKEVEEGEIVSSFIALPGVEEEYAEEKEKIKEELIKRGLKGRVTIGSDQLSAFRSSSKGSTLVLLFFTRKVHARQAPKRQESIGKPKPTMHTVERKDLNHTPTKTHSHQRSQDSNTKTDTKSHPKNHHRQTDE